MINLYKYNDKEKEEILKSMIILVDGREKDGKNQHILEWFDKKNIPYKKKSLEYGDYSVMLPANEELGILKPLDFSREIMIERKSGLTELSGNMTKDRSRIEKEFALAPKYKILLIENASYEDIVEGNYNTNYNRKSFLGTLHSWYYKYNIPFFFMKNKEYSGLFIYMYFQYYLKNYLR